MSDRIIVRVNKGKEATDLISSILTDYANGTLVANEGFENHQAIAEILRNACSVKFPPVA